MWISHVSRNIIPFFLLLLLFACLFVVVVVCFVVVVLFCLFVSFLLCFLSISEIRSKHIKDWKERIFIMTQTYTDTLQTLHTHTTHTPHYTRFQGNSPSSSENWSSLKARIVMLISEIAGAKQQQQHWIKRTVDNHSKRAPILNVPCLS